MTGTWASGWATGDVVTAAEFKKSAGSIYDTTLGASAATIDITGIVQTYAHLLLTLYLRGDVGALTTSALMQFNGDVGTNYDYQALIGQAATAVASETFGATSTFTGECPGATAGTNLFSASQILIPHYAGTANNKQVTCISSKKSGVATTNIAAVLSGGSWRSNAAINRITIFPQTGANWVAGSRLTVHAMGA